jgi:hypothetical protein
MAHNLTLVSEQGGSRGTPQSDPLPAAENPPAPPLPPVVLFLPGLSALSFNTSARLAEVMCADLTRGEGTYVNDHVVPDADQIVEVAGMKPTRIVQFTDEKLTWSGIRARRGFLSHGDYWSVPGAGNCLSVVLSAVRAALTKPDTASLAETPD